MAKSNKKTTKLDKAPKPAKAAKTESTMTPFQAVQSFNPKGKVSWQDFCRSQKEGPLGRTLGLNETGLSIVVDKDRDAGIKSINDILIAFKNICKFWSASASYGFQHYNGDGVVHIDGLQRVKDESLAILATQALEELAQRSASKGSQVIRRNVDPDTASKLFKIIQSWMAARPAEIANERKSQALKEVAELVQEESAKAKA